jgi:hypothetical protein
MILSQPAAMRVAPEHSDLAERLAEIAEILAAGTLTAV